MTVKSLSDQQKIEISDLYLFRGYTIKQMALIYNRSGRTIIRALEEKGCYTAKRRLPKPKPLPVCIPLKTPWWKKLLQNMRFTYTGREDGPRV